MGVCTCVCGETDAVKVLMSAPFASQHCRLLFLKQRAVGSLCPRGVFPPHSFPIIPGVSLRGQPSRRLLWLLLTLCLHPSSSPLGLLCQVKVRGLSQSYLRGGTGSSKPLWLCARVPVCVFLHPARTARDGQINNIPHVQFRITQDPAGETSHSFCLN